MADGGRLTEVVDKVLQTSQSKTRITLLASIPDIVLDSENLPPDVLVKLLGAAAKEIEERAKAALLRTCVRCALRDAESLKTVLTHAAWTGVSPQVVIEALKPFGTCGGKLDLSINPMLTQVIETELTSAETKLALRNHCCDAWTIALRACEDKVVPKASLAFLSNPVAGLLAPLTTPTKQSAEHALAVCECICALLHAKPHVFQHLEANKIPIDRIPEETEPTFATVIVCNLVQSLDWVLRSSNLETKRTKDRMMQLITSLRSVLTLETRRILVTSYVKMVVHDHLGGYPVFPNARHRILRELCGSDNLTVTLGHDLLSAVIWTEVATDPGAKTHEERLNRWIKFSKTHFDCPNPTPSFKRFLGAILKSYHSASVPRVVQFMSECRLRHWNPDVVTDWHHFWTEFYSEYLVPAFDLSVITTDDVVPNVKKSEAAPAAVIAAPAPAKAAVKAPATSAKAKAKSKAKAAATARLLAAAKMAGPTAVPTPPSPTPSPTLTASSSMPSNTPVSVALKSCSSSEYGQIVVGTVEMLATCWPMVVAEVLPSLIVRLKDCVNVPILNLVIQRLLSTLVRTFVDAEAVPSVRLLPQLLYDCIKPRGKCNIEQADELCSGLQEKYPLSGEASVLVLPVILSLLAQSADSEVSLVAIHRAVASVAQQTRLGAKLESSNLMAIITMVMRSQPGLLHLCVAIVSSLRDIDPNVLAPLMDSDDVDFRRTVTQTIDRLLENSDADLTPESLKYVLAAKYDTDEIIKTFASRFEIKPAVEDVLDLLNSYSQAVSHSIGRAIAREDWGKTPEELIDVLAHTFEHRVAPPAFELPEEFKKANISISQLTSKQLAAIKEAHKRDYVATQGQKGCIYCLGYFARFKDPLPESVAIKILDMCLYLASAEYDAELETECHLACQNVVESSHDILAPLERYLSTAITMSLTPPASKTSTKAPAGTDRILTESGLCIATTALAMVGHRLASPEACALLVDVITTPSSSLKVKRNAASVVTPLLKLKMKLDALVNRAEALAFEDQDAQKRASGALLLAACIRAGGWHVCNGSDTLVLMASERKEWWARQGAFLTFEAVFDLFGQSLENSVQQQILPAVLTGAADLRPEVRDAARAVGNKLMSKLTGSALQQTLPTLLSFASNPSWRSKLGAIELLGRVSSLRQATDILSDMLAQVLPVVIDAAHSPHNEVQQAGRKALYNLVDGIQTPELASVKDTLFKALIEHSDSNITAFLDQMIELPELEHYLDSSSVCLIHTVLNRALAAPKSDARHKACQLIGILPCICQKPEAEIGPRIQPTLHELFRNLGDPQPFIRQTAARAIGLLVKSMKAIICKDTLPYLIRNLKTVNNVVERSGCANALVEVFFALGKDVLSQHLQDIFKQASLNPSVQVREGFLGLFVYLPTIFGEDFKEFVPDCLPVLLGGLGASEEPVREIAFRATKIFVQQYGATHTPLLLAPLEAALYHDAPEVRLRAIGLLGTLVDKILRGVEESTAEGGQQMQLEILSLERRAYILSAIYLARGDEEPEVRQHAAAVWKRVVQNTPRTVKELLPILTKRLMDLLASGVETKEGIGGRCMQELIAKHGDKLLPEVIDVFLANLKKKNVDDASFRGVFIGLQAVVQAAHPVMLRKHLQPIFPVVTTALVNPALNVVVKEQIVLAVVLIAEAEDRARQELTKKKEKEKKGGPVVVDPFVDKTVSKLVIGPLLKAVVDSEDDNAEHYISTIGMFMKFATQLVVNEVITIVRKSPLTRTKLRLLRTIAGANAATVLQHLRDILRIFEKELNDETYAELGSESREVLAQICGVLNPEDIMGRVAGWLKDMFQLNEAIVSCDAKSWDGYRHRVSGEPLLTTELLIETIRPNQPEPRLSAPWARAVVTMVASGIYKSQPAETVSVWIEPFTEELLNDCLLPASLSDIHPAVVTEASFLLQNVTRVMERTLLVMTSVNLHKVLTRSAGDNIVLPGACCKQSFESYMAILHPALLYGSDEVKEQAAWSFAALVDASDTATLNGVAVKVAGQLIRGFAERATTETKRHILRALTRLLEVVGAPLRLLVPQLQSSFVRCIDDEELGMQAAAALTLLSTLAGPRVNLLMTELSKNLSTGAHVTAVIGVLRQAGTQLSPATLLRVSTALEQSAAAPALVQEALALIDEL